MNKRANGEGSFRQRQNGTWEGMVRLPGPDGRMVRTSFYGSTLREVQRAVLDARRRVDDGLPGRDSSETVEDFLRRWLRDVAPLRVRASTLDSYRSIIEKRLVPDLGGYTLARLEPRHVGAWITATLATKPRRRGAERMSPRYVRHCLAILRLALKVAEREGGVVRNVAMLVDPPKAAGKVRRPPDPDQLRKILDALSDHRLSAFYQLTLVTGMRSGEARALRWQDVDLEDGTVRIEHSLEYVRDPDREKGRVLRLGPPKTEKSQRVLPIGAATVATMRDHLRRQKEERLARGAGAPHPDDFVFTAEDGEPLRPDVVQKILKDAAEEAGLGYAWVHGLRHGSASLLHAGGADLKEIQARLGHASIATTANVYTHLFETGERRLANQMDKLLAGPKKKTKRS
jgi:integrase